MFGDNVSLRHLNKLEDQILLRAKFTKRFDVSLKRPVRRPDPLVSGKGTG